MVYSKMTTWCNNTEDHHLHSYCCENLKSYNIYYGGQGDERKKKKKKRKKAIY
jgi:hypothetical protein